MQFRTLAASNPQLQWNLRHSELWLDNLSSQTGSFSLNTRWPCTYCGSTSHFPDRCPRCPFPTVHLSNDNASQQPDYSHAEISIIPPANATPAVINTAANTVAPPLTLHTDAGGHLFPAEVLGPRTCSPL